MLRLAALWWTARVAAQEVTPTPLRLHQDQSFLDAARQACTPTETPEAKDNCVGGAMSIIVNQHLRAAKDGQAADATALASPGVSLVRDDLEKYDPVSWVGQSPLHVDIELPIQVKRTVCDAERCFE